MIFLGGTFLAGDVMSIPMTSTSIDNITNITIYNGLYDDLYVTTDTEYTLTAEVDQDWTYDTVLWAQFNDSTGAGNVDWGTSAITQILVKRKRSDEFQWITLEAKDVNDLSDCNFQGTDFTAMPETSYDYAVVPVSNGIEGFYNIASVDVTLDNLMICDYDQVWTTKLTDGALDTESIVPVQTFDTMNSKYPTVVRNGSANYETIQINAEFVPVEDCQYKFTGASVVDYRKQFKTFLRNGNPKIVKAEDSRMWLCYLTSNITDSQQDVWCVRSLSWTMAECGSCTKEEDLYNAKFIDTPEQYWSNAE